MTFWKAVLTFETMDKILWYDHSNESYWAVLSCGTVYYAVQGGSKNVLSFESVDEILWCILQYFPVQPAQQT